jgi:succinate-semialdehyde dehydrogenase / glutarate-semialdehyde dehydrogenase
MSQNPATGEILKTFESISEKELIEKLDLAKKMQKRWRETSLAEREKLMCKFADLLREKREELAMLITLEMGCPIVQARTEIEKCASIAEMFGSHTVEYLKAEKHEIGAKESYVRFDPLGTLFHIAPWNYPFYLALRPIIPALMAGNTVVLKHASNVPQISLMIEKMFLEAGFGLGVCQSLLISSSQSEIVIGHDAVQVVSLIGSENAGSAVATLAGKYLKKTVMELGGNDPMLVYSDADLDKVVEGIMFSRMRNCGQSCNAPKRVIVEASVHDLFVEKLKNAMCEIRIGDPFDDVFDMGPVATYSASDEVFGQVQDSIKLGARAVLGGNKIDGNGYYFEPTILIGVTTEMPVFVDEVFGPVVTVIRAQRDEILGLANDSRYGLGASVWTADYEFARELIMQIEAGNVYVNAVVRGDPKMPFGGVKKTGYGREFGEYGIKEFVNIKSVVIK